MGLLLSLLLGAPLLASIVITLLPRGWHRLSGFLALFSIATSFLISLTLFCIFTLHGSGMPWETSITWLQMGPLVLEWGYLINPLTLVMLLVVTGIGTVIFIFSWGYMQGDEGWSRYFASLSFFAFSMLGIVLANNFLQIFIFWELVGLSSYLLIAFWFEKESAALAGKKAFLVNKIGDVLFLFGILLIWFFSSPLPEERSLNFLVLSQRLPELGLLPDTLFWLSLFVFAGVVGKSAQFPLHVWLPDAMEGPTPVSAFIHAATMVAAGIYLLARTFFLFELSPDALLVVGSIGLITCVLAALMAIAQDDIKRILAYSTLSQLGYMVLAVGAGGPSEGIFHLSTHACFKALLFLGAGSVIHALMTQDIWQMGGLRTKLPITSVTFLIGTLALVGIYPFAGFFSKDLILEVVQKSNPVFFIGALVTVFLTAFYMGRLYSVAFLGSPPAQVQKSHESPWVMTLPLIILAFLSLIAGFLPIEQFLTGHAPQGFNGKLSLTATALALGGLGLSLLIFLKRSHDPLVPALGFFHKILKRKFFIDELYDGCVRLLQGSWTQLLGWCDRYIVVGLEEDVPQGVSRFLALGIRRLQSGSLTLYVFLFVASIAAITVWGVVH